MPSPSNNRLTTWRYWPHTLIALAVLLRLWHIWNSRKSPTFWAPAVDPGWYDAYAQAIVRGEWGPFPFFRAPLYSAFLASVYAVFGHDLVMARLLNVLFQGLAAWGIFKVGESYFSRPAAIIATALFALNGSCIFYGGEILSVSFEILASVIVAWTTLRLQRELSTASVIVCGLSWGIAAIIRPNFLMVAPAAALAIFYLIWKSNDLRKLPVWLALWAAALLIPILPVTLINKIKGHETVLIATQGGVNFWIGNNPQATGILSVLPGYGNTWLMEDAELEAERETGRKLGQGALSDFYYDKGKDFVRAHPVEASRLMIRKTLLFFNRYEISNNKHIEYFAGLTPGLNLLLHLNFGLLVPLAMVGFWGLRLNYSARILLILIAFYAISVILFFITTRFRLPAVPWLAWLAGASIVYFYSEHRAGQKLWSPIILLICGIAVAFLNIWNLSEAPNGWARFMEGNAYMKLNQPDSARVCFNDAIMANEAVSRSRLNLGVLAYRDHNFDEAANQYQLSLLAEPTNAETWNNLGIVFEARGDTQKALDAYHRSISARPLSSDAKHNLAGLHFRIGIRNLKISFDTVAVAHFDSCLALDPSPVALYNRAIALGRLGQIEQAVIDLQSVVKSDPTLLEARSLLSQFQNALIEKSQN